MTIKLMAARSSLYTPSVNLAIVQRFDPLFPQTRTDKYSFPYSCAV